MEHKVWLPPLAYEQERSPLAYAEWLEQSLNQWSYNGWELVCSLESQLIFRRPMNGN